MIAACSAGVGAGLIVQPSGGAGLAAAALNTSGQPSSPPWYLMYLRRPNSPICCLYCGVGARFDARAVYQIPCNVWSGVGFGAFANESASGYTRLKSVGVT